MQINKIIAVLASILWCCTASAAVKLTVTETASIARTSAPVTYGVPFSFDDNITSTAAFKLSTDLAGTNTVDAQFRVLSRYADTPGGTGAIRVVLVDFQNTISSGDSETFYLHTTGGSGSASGNLATVNGSNVDISTGSMAFTISASTGWFSSAGSNLGTATSDGWLIRSTSGTDYASWNETSAITIEENGPLRAVVKATGYFKDSGGGKLVPTNADEGLAYTTRFIFYKNKSYVKVQARLENNNKGLGTSSVDVAHYTHVDYSYLKTTTAVTGETVDFGGATYSGLTNYSLHQDEVSDGSAQSYTWEKSINGGAVTTDQYESYAEVRDGSVGLMVGMRWFWQQHPKQYRFIDNVSYMDLWPDESSNPRGTKQMDSSGNHRILGGMWKTHELIYYFNDGAAADQASVLADLTDRLIATCTDTYYAETGFFYPFAPATIPITDVDYGDVALSDVITQDTATRRGFIDSDYIEDVDGKSIIDLRDNREIPGPGTPAYWSWYGDVEFGNLPRGNASYGYSGAHYGWDYSSMVSFLRFQDRDYLELAEQLAVHRADITVMHDAPSLVSPDPEAFFHGAHRYEIDSLQSFTDGMQSVWSANPRDGSHLWFRGIALEYLLTGEERFLDSLNAIAEGRKYVAFVNWDCTSYCSSTFTIRGAGRSLGAIATHYMVTGDSDSLTKAYQLYENALKSDLVSYGNGSYLENIAGDSEASNLQTPIAAEFLMQFHQILTNAGEATKADDVKSTLKSIADWVEQYVLGYYSCADGFDAGDFGTGAYAGQYLPYMYAKLWDSAANWTCGSFSGVSVYTAIYYADLFSWLKDKGYGDDYLTTARGLIKDWYLYGLPDEWQTVATTMPDVKAFKGVQGNAWAKYGQPLKMGNTYLSLEWVRETASPRWFRIGTRPLRILPD